MTFLAYEAETYLWSLKMTGLLLQFDQDQHLSFASEPMYCPDSGLWQSEKLLRALLLSQFRSAEGIGRTRPPTSWRRSSVS